MGQFVDLTGKKFGSLTVTGISSKSDKYDNIYWNCLCECGKNHPVRASSLKNGHTKSCGCIKLVEDDAGKVFGELTVLGRIDKISSSPFLNCLCSCGAQLPVRRDLLTKGKIISCGNKLKHKNLKSKLIDETGNVYGKLKVIQQHSEKIVTKGTLWDCICECGNYKTVRALFYVMALQRLVDAI